MKVQQTNKYKLSIQLALDGFSFLIFDSEKNRIVKEKEFLYTQKKNFYDWLNENLAKEEVLKKKYISTQILICTEKQTLVPKEFAKEDKEKDVLAINFPIGKTEMILSENLDEIVILSAIDSELYNLVKGYFSEAKWETIPLFLLKQQEQISKSWNIKVLLLNNRLHIMVSRNGKVQLYNSFSFQTEDDILYYVFYIFDNLDIPVTNSTIRLWGNQNYCKTTSTSLRNYHPDIQIVNHRARIKTETTFGQLLSSIL